mmetsp:Transcript_63384/g.138873  ORF Transcript_63384/g.138873 Transcript_63384/m.138873 type:complete len:114 (+) Transcript_63384:1155-1496(+)
MATVDLRPGVPRLEWGWPPEGLRETPCPVWRGGDLLPGRLPERCLDKLYGRLPAELRRTGPAASSNKAEELAVAPRERCGVSIRTPALCALSKAPRTRLGELPSRLELQLELR